MTPIYQRARSDTKPEEAEVIVGFPGARTASNDQKERNDER